MARDDPQMKIRLPDELKKSLERAASAARRTQNAEIVSRLQASFAAESFEIPPFLKRAPEAAAAVTDSGAVVLHLALTPGMTVEKVLELLEAAQMALPEGTQLVVDQR